MRTFRQFCVCFGVAVTLSAMVGCNNGNNGGGAGAGGAGGGSAGAGGSGGSGMPPDMACVPHPQTSTELLNGCTDAQTGDANKDYPYFPPLAAGGHPPPLN